VPVRHTMTFALVGMGLVLTGCANQPSTPPEITFVAKDKTVAAKPFRYCNVEVTECTEDRNAVAYLTLPAGATVEVRVPDDVAATPWSVTIGYVTATGEQKDQMVGVFTKGDRETFTAQAPAPGDSLTTVEVKQAGGRLEDEGGQPQVVPRAVWSLQIQRG
jgi:hypothetical protein